MLASTTARVAATARPSVDHEEPPRRRRSVLIRDSGGEEGCHVTGVRIFIEMGGHPRHEPRLLNRLLAHA